MTKLYLGVKVLTYEEWIKLPVIAEAGIKREKCDLCDGMGNHECECGDTHECRACDGTGYLDKTRNVYEKQLRNEIEHLQSWINGDKVRSLATIPHAHEEVTMLKINIQDKAAA
jgi:hypothetical protein